VAVFLRRGKKESIMDRSQRGAARIFGITYFLTLAIIMVVFPRYYAPYLVWEDGEATARHIIGHEPAIRLYLGGAFLYGIGMVVLLTSLYVLLRGVNRGMALFAAASKVLYVVFWFVQLLEVFGAMNLLGGAGSLRTFGSDGLAALAGSRFSSSRDGYYIGLVFNGLGSAAFAWVFFESRYIPRIVAAWGVMASLYEGFCGFAYLMHPNFGAVLSPNGYELPLMTFELILSVWLLIQGFRKPKAAVTQPQEA
jgi:hypothetical protein